jgi:hypothetical protein
VSKIYSIKCPNCNAPLSLLGGGRVKSVTCAYCKSVIDLNNNYKILSQFKNVAIPPSPFKVGMKGKIEGVEWTIIGWIVYKDYSDILYRWSEFLLFSPLYGYAWLVYEDGEIFLSRRVRDLDLRKWQKEESQTLFFRGGHYILKEESYYSIIDFVQGELNYIAKYGDKIRCWDYKGVKGQSISIEKSNNELEVYYNKKLDARSVYNSFDVKESERRIKEPTLNDKFNLELEEGKPLSFYGIVAIFLALLAMIVLSFNEHEVLKERVTKNRETMFTITSSAFLTHIHIDTPNHQTLNSYRVGIIKNGKTIFEIDKDRVFFSKKNLGNSWSKRAKGANIYIKLDRGRYLLKIEKIGTTTNSIEVTITDKSIRLFYILPLFFIILLFLIYIIAMDIDISFIKIAGFVFALIFLGVMLMYMDFSTLFIIGVIGYSIFFNQGEKDD